MRARLTSTGQQTWRRWVCCSLAALCIAVSPLHSASPGRYISIAWDPTADVGVIGYAVYVGTSPRHYDQLFLVSNRTYFTYADAVPGTQYYFAVVAYTNSLVSDFSVEVSGFGQSTPALPVSNGLDARDPPTGIQPLTSSAAQLPIAAIDASVNALAAPGDGRLFVVEDEQRVHVFDGQTFIAGAALVAAPAVKLVGIAIGPQFDRLRRVYIAEEERRADGSREMRVVRYREVQNTLGEAAVVVTGVQLPPTGAAAFTVDAYGRIFIAVPSSDPDTASSGVVLGFEADGGALQQNRSASPIVARAPSLPVAIGWDETAQQLWVTGSDAGRPAIVRIPVRALGTADVWPRIPESVQLEGVAPVFRTASQQPITGTSLLLRLSAGGRLIRVDAGATTVEELPALEAGELVATTMDARTNAAYLAVRSPRGLRAYLFRIEK